MEERKLLESSNLTVLLQNQGMYPGAHFPAFEGRATKYAFDRQPLFKAVELDSIGDDDSDDSLRHHKSKRRLTTDQVRLLEISFELENKLEPERKAQLAKALGLKPRQIAIWFQNRRARWKTKRLEKDYEALRSSYESLKVDHECLLKEKEELEAEVLSLTKKLLLKERSGDWESSDKPRSSESPSGFNSTILDSESTPCVDEEGYNSMLMELTSSSNAFELDDNNLSLEDNSCGYGLLLWS